MWTVRLQSKLRNVFNKNVKGCFDEEAMELVNQGINPLLFRGLKTTITSDESRQINFDTKPKLSCLHPVCAKQDGSGII